MTFEYTIVLLPLMMIFTLTLLWKRIREALLLIYLNIPFFRHKRLTAYRKARALLREKMQETGTFAVFLRLAWSDAATFDKSIVSWPRCGGANGSIRFDRELDHPENRGLIVAITFLENIKDECMLVSWADLIQMAGSCAVELLGGPLIPIRYGRIDAADRGDYTYQLSEKLPRAHDPYPDGYKFYPKFCVHL